MKTTFTLLTVLIFSFSLSAQDIHQVVRQGDVNKIYDCLVAGADINAPDQYGRTPIMIAALIGNMKVVNYLIENKCDVNAADYKGRTALDYSIRMKNIKITEVLQKNNAIVGTGIHDESPEKSVGSDNITKPYPEKNIQANPKTFDAPRANLKKEAEPKFPGGNDALHKYLKNNVKYPEEAKKDSLEGTAHVKFEVTPEGNVVNPEITRSDNVVFNAEALRLIKEMPKWEVEGVEKNRDKNRS